jgi:type IV secretion system protein VirB5
MADPVWILPAGKDAGAAKRQFVELYGSTVVTNAYLRVALICLGAVCLGLIFLNLKTHEVVRNFKPLVIRINDVGRAEAVRYGAFEYRPQEAEIKYFLMDFVQRHYGRMKATVRDNHARSLFFLDGRLTDALIEANRKNQTIETFLAGSEPEVDINVKNVAIEDLRQPPYRATVEFEKVYYSVPDRAELKRETYVANIVFVVKDTIPNAWIPVNPLGLTITYFREDQAFQ